MHHYILLLSYKILLFFQQWDFDYLEMIKELKPQHQYDAERNIRITGERPVRPNGCEQVAGVEQVRGFERNERVDRGSARRIKARTAQLFPLEHAERAGHDHSRDK